jgi:hypothetical protein
LINYPVGRRQLEMTSVIERTEGHYEVYEIPYGKDYVWCPECVVVECDCGERPSLTVTETTCECGADHTGLVQEELKSQAPSEETPSPEDECEEWRKHKDEYLHSEHNDQLEWEMMK